ncbi:MAG TPA: clostripain-related cysteine peptidase [Polyangiaceae bacterium]|nr:clostripain-related cysteine peptidase [Polyangiaceae bacterium]
MKTVERGWGARSGARSIRCNAALRALLLAAVCAACSGEDSEESNNGGNPTAHAGAAGAPAGGRGGAGDPTGTGGSQSSAGGGGAATGIGTTTPDGEEPPSIDELADNPTASVPWTILVYGHADHTLSNGLYDDMLEMGAAQLGGAVQLLVLADWDASQSVFGTDPPLPFPDGVQLYRVPGDGQPFELLAQGAEANLDDPNLLAGIVADVFTALPSERRGLILWDHGGSWSGGFGGDTQNGTTEGSPLPPQEVADAVRVGLADAGLSGSRPLDFFAFDTCLMAGAEVAYPFRDLARVYIADAEIDYGAGWDYTTTLTYFAQNPTASMNDLGMAEVFHWDAHHSTGLNDRLLRSHAALDLSQMEAYAEATSTLSETLLESESFDPTELARSVFFSVSPYRNQLEGGSDEPGLRDAGQVLDALAAIHSDPAVASAALAARQALGNVVLASSQGALRADAQIGVHVEQTLGSNLTAERLLDYRSAASQWVGASRWDELLEFASSTADDEPPPFDHALIDAEAASLAAPPVLQFSTPDPTAAKAAVRLAVQRESGALLTLGLVGAGLVEPGAVHDFAWGGTVVGFADGQPGMVDVWLDVAAGDQAVLSIPGLVGGIADEPVLAYLVFGASESVARVLIQTSDELATSQETSEVVRAFPGATFTPLYLEYGEAPEPSSVLGNPMPIPAEGFALSAMYQPAGNYYFFTTLTDIWGKESADYDVVALTEPLGP